MQLLLFATKVSDIEGRTGASQENGANSQERRGRRRKVCMLSDPRPEEFARLHCCILISFG